MTNIMNGQQLAEQIVSEVAIEIETFQQDFGVTPGLAVVPVKRACVSAGSRGVMPCHFHY